MTSAESNRIEQAIDRLTVAVATSGQIYALAASYQLGVQHTTAQELLKKLSLDLQTVIRDATV